MDVKVDRSACASAAPCLHEGPLMVSARAAVDAARRLGVNQQATAIRSRSVPYVFDGMERVFAAGLPPAAPLIEMIDRLTDMLTNASRDVFGQRHGDARVDRDSRSVAEITGEHYGRLFKEFSSTSYWDEPVRLLRQRLERNEIAPQNWEGGRLLDAGCGGGRYTVAWRMLRAGHVVGVDVSEVGVGDARERVRQAGIDGVEFETGDVLDLPFDADSFDAVFSNGVLHHTVDWRRGIREVVRVLKPGGFGWLYLIEKPGGFFWDLIEFLREIMRDDDRSDVRRVLQSSGLPANRVFYMLDHVMVPINVRSTPAEVEQALASAGATIVRRLSRGADFDRVEALQRGEPFAADKYGVGENRYVFSKHVNR